MHTETVKTRILDVTPVTENSQLHDSVNHVARILCEAEKKEKIGKKVKQQNLSVRESMQQTLMITTLYTEAEVVCSCSVNIMSGKY